MDNNLFISYEIEDKSMVGFVKREIHYAAVRASFSVSRVGIIDIVVAELTSNIIKHASGGELLYRFSKENGLGVFEILCIDNGPGIKDISHSMKDGVTTTKTLGQGLGALKRLCDSFYIYSIVAWGTVCYSKIYTARYTPPADPSDIKFGTLNVSKPGQTVSGDGFDVLPGSDYVKIFMGDGLGHGKEASDATQIAIANFKTCRENDPAKILGCIHDPVKKSRGLVATVVTGDYRLKKWSICGIGNVATRLYEGIMTKNYINYNGIIGLTIPTTLKNHETDLRKHQCLVMSTDGIGTKWALSQFPSILRYDPLMFAAVIYKACRRKNDDSSILIART
jgi:anti-sigma regulatory factor (Ser/Thr protein kinase)